MVESINTVKQEAYLRLNGFLTLPSID